MQSELTPLYVPLEGAGYKVIYANAEDIDTLSKLTYFVREQPPADMVLPHWDVRAQHWIELGATIKQDISDLQAGLAGVADIVAGGDK